MRGWYFLLVRPKIQVNFIVVSTEWQVLRFPRFSSGGRYCSFLEENCPRSLYKVEFVNSVEYSQHSGLVPPDKTTMLVGNTVAYPSACNSRIWTVMCLRNIQLSIDTNHRA